MKHHARAIIFAALLSGAAVSPSAADSPPDVSPSNTAAGAVTDPRQVASRYQQIVSEPQYQESNEPETNAWIRSWLSQWVNRLEAEFGQFKYAQEMPRFASLLLTLFVLLSLIGLIYILHRLTRGRVRWDQATSSEETLQTTFRPPEFYAEELRQAVAKNDWRGAWLASWRQLLSRLEKNRLVEADRSRTNREYLAQLRAQSLPEPAVKLLTTMVEEYDQSIYGRQRIAEPEWTSFQNQADEATLLLHLQDGPRATRGKYPRFMTRNGTYIRVLLVLIALVVLLSFINRSPRNSGGDTWLPSSFNPVGAGNMAFYQTLSDLNWPVERWREPLSRLSTYGKGNTLIITRSRVGARASFSEQEIDLLADWVKSGNRLVLLGALGEWDDTREMLRRFGFLVPEDHSANPINEFFHPIEAKPGEQIEALPARQSGKTGRLILPLTAPLPASYSPQSRVLWEQQGRPYVVEVPYGAGEVVCGASALLLDNSFLSKGDNLAIVLQLLAPGGKVPQHLFFEESHHGFSTIYAVVRLLDHPGVRFSAMLTLLALLALLCSSLMRFGPIIPLQRAGGRSTLEFVDSIADLYQRADLRNDMIGYLFRETHQRILHRLNLPSTAPHELIGTRLAQAYPQLPRWKKLAQRFDSLDYVNGLPPSGWLLVARELIEINLAMA